MQGWKDLWVHFGAWIEYFFSPENLRTLLFYQEEEPLMFTRLYFWIFLAVVCMGFALTHQRVALRNLYLFLVSLFFYYKTSGLFVLILIFSTVSDYFIGLGIHHAPYRWVKKLLLALSITLNLSILAYFKYAYFFTDVLNQMFDTEYRVFHWLAYGANLLLGTDFDVHEILLPVGISFYTFQTISYTVDVYRGHVQPVRNILDFGFYVSFFPQLVAGPIVRASSFVPQLYRPYHLTSRDFGFAIWMISKGLIKKLIFGDYIAVLFVDRVFAQPTLFTGFENMSAVFGYSLQVYADFSGYTDMAIGVARLFGFELPENFRSPYKAQNVGEFWKRWHMSLSSWLKDYLYIPLGGNRHGSLASLLLVLLIAVVLWFLARKVWVRIAVVSGLLILGILYLLPWTRRHVTTNINLMLTMLLGGLWHGANWQFVMWGGINGLGLIIYKYWKRISPFTGSRHPLAIAWGVLLTFTFITFTRLWFRAPTIETVDWMLYQIRYHFAGSLIPEIIQAHWKFYLLFTLGMIIHWLPQSWKDRLREMYETAPLWVHVSLFAGTVILAYQGTTGGLQPFIYFQF